MDPTMINIFHVYKFYPASSKRIKNRSTTDFFVLFLLLFFEKEKAPTNFIT